MGKRTKPRDKAKERFWRRAIRRRERSGLSVRAFCEQEGLAESAFYFWRREVQKRDAEQAVARPPKPAGSRKATNRSKELLGSKRRVRPAFAAVTVASPQGADRHGVEDLHAIEIVLRNSLRVRVARGFDAQTLRDVLAVLEDRPC